MSITVSSTTDTPADVALAAGLEPTIPAADANSNANVKDVDTGADALPESGDGSGPSEKQDDAEDDSAQADHSEPSDNADDDNDNDDNDAEAVDSEGKPIKGKGGFQKRIDRATRKIAAVEAARLQTEQQNLELKLRLADLERRISTAPKPDAKPDAKPEPPTLGPPPVAKDFNTYEEFLNAMGAYAAKGVEHATTVAESKAAAKVAEEVAKVRAEFEARESQRTQQSQADQVYANFNAKVESEAKPVYKDWDTVVANNQSLRISETQRAVMLTHEKGHHLAYWFGKNPTETARIAALPEGMQLLELGQILPNLGKAKSKPTVGADNGASSTPTTPKVTTAPKPIKPIGSAKPAKRAYTAKDIENMSYQQYKQLRNDGVI